MIKTYRSNTNYSITVRTASGNRCHIKFTSDSYGKSYYITTDKEIQDALESTGLLGDMYFIESTVEDIKKEEEPAKETEITTVEVSDIEEAREYLNEHYGVAKRNMRSTASIKAIAEKNGIEFVGI